MKNYDKKQVRNALNSEITDFFNCFSPSEAEDILFEVFNDANIENLAAEILSERAILHTKLRKILRVISQNTEPFKELYNDKN